MQLIISTLVSELQPATSMHIQYNTLYSLQHLLVKNCTHSKVVLILFPDIRQPLLMNCVLSTVVYLLERW